MKKPKLELIDQDGNAFVLLGLAKSVAKKNKMDWEAIKKEATSGDYNHLIVALMKHFDVQGEA